MLEGRGVMPDVSKVDKLSPGCAIHVSMAGWLDGWTAVG